MDFDALFFSANFAHRQTTLSMSSPFLSKSWTDFFADYFLISFETPTFCDLKKPSLLETTLPKMPIWISLPQKKIPNISAKIFGVSFSVAKILRKKAQVFFLICLSLQAEGAEITAHSLTTSIMTSLFQKSSRCLHHHDQPLMILQMRFVCAGAAFHLKRKWILPISLSWFAISSFCQCNKSSTWACNGEFGGEKEMNWSEEKKSLEESAWQQKSAKISESGVIYIMEIVQGFFCRWDTSMYNLNANFH